MKMVVDFVFKQQTPDFFASTKKKRLPASYRIPSGSCSIQYLDCAITKQKNYSVATMQIGYWNFNLSLTTQRTITSVDFFTHQKYNHAATFNGWSNLTRLNLTWDQAQFSFRRARRNQKRAWYKPSTKRLPPSFWIHWHLQESANQNYFRCKFFLVCKFFIPGKTADSLT